MNATAKQDGGQRWAVIGLLVAFLAAGGYAALLHYKSQDLEAALATMRDEAAKTQQATAVLAGNIKTLSEKSAALEQQQKLAAKLAVLAAQVEPQLGGILEATAANAKANKPDVRGAALVSLGLVSQVAHGVGNEAARGFHERALAIDPANCVGRLALGLGGGNAGEMPPECAALLPDAATAGEAKPAAAAPAEAPAAPPAPAK